jgi:hypothetical protein
VPSSALGKGLMANSEYEYVKREFEFDRRLPPSNWIVVRIDGCHFHRYRFWVELRKRFIVFRQKDKKVIHDSVNSLHSQVVIDHQFRRFLFDSLFLLVCFAFDLHPVSYVLLHSSMVTSM